MANQPVGGRYAKSKGDEEQKALDPLVAVRSVTHHASVVRSAIPLWTGMTQKKTGVGILDAGV
jgi:hypothetical protein